METSDTESTLQEYEIQLEQVEIALKSDPSNEELLKLKQDLIEVINLTKDLLKEELNEKIAKNKPQGHQWKPGDKCMAIWRVDGKYYSATVEQILEDGSCTVIFDGYSTPEVTQIALLMTRSKTSTAINKDVTSKSSGAQVGHKKAYTKKEIEQKLKEARKKKKENYAKKIAAIEELHEKEKKKWTSFNTKLASRTWKGVVSKNKFDIPSDHENKIGVGANKASSSETRNSSAYASATVQGASKQAKQTPK